jgi:outer membrane biogenesis lipoprotein LolB
MAKYNLTSFRKIAFNTLFVFFTTLLSANIFAQSDQSEEITEKYIENIYLFLTSEIALQRGEVAAAYQTLFNLARSTKDPRIAQRAMEIALMAKSPKSSLDAAKLWDELTPPTDNTSREVYLTLLFINQYWSDSVEPTIKFLRYESVKKRDEFLKQVLPLFNKADNQDEALLAFAKIVGELKPLSKDSEVLFLYALGQEKAGNLEKMEDALQSLLKNNPNDANALNALGYAFAERNIRLTEALYLINKANQLTPNNPFILDSLGWVNYRLGNNDLAIKYLQESFDQLAEAEVGAHLGEVLFKAGKEADADIVWRKAESINANNSTLKETLRRLRPTWTNSAIFDSKKSRKWDGRFSVKINDAKSQDGGSGAFTLNHEDFVDDLEIRSPIGTSIAKIQIKPGSASLEQNGKVINAIDADQLMAQTLGLPIPARGLTEWLSGFPRAGSQSTIKRNTTGQVEEIIQDSWTLKYTWSNDNKLQKLEMNRSDRGTEIDIRLIFNLINE